jgi:hypothetical protein
MLETQEKINERYVTEDMIEKAFERFGNNLEKNLKTMREEMREDHRKDTKEIIDASIATAVPPMINTAIEASENRLGLLMMKHFDRVDKRIDDLEETMNQRFEAVDRRFEAVDQRFEAIDARFDAVDRRFDRVDARFDSHLLDCVRRLEHTKIEKRVSSLELLKRKLAVE